VAVGVVTEVVVVAVVVVVTVVVSLPLSMLLLVSLRPWGRSHCCSTLVLFLQDILENKWPDQNIVVDKDADDQQQKADGLKCLDKNFLVIPL
jgi:hypothetical protein